MQTSSGKTRFRIQITLSPGCNKLSTILRHAWQHRMFRKHVLVHLKRLGAVRERTPTWMTSTQEDLLSSCHRSSSIGWQRRGIHRQGRQVWQIRMRLLSPSLLTRETRCDKTSFFRSSLQLSIWLCFKRRWKRRQYRAAVAALRMQTTTLRTIYSHSLSQIVTTLNCSMQTATTQVTVVSGILVRLERTVARSPGTLFTLRRMDPSDRVMHQIQPVEDRISRCWSNGLALTRTTETCRQTWCQGQLMRCLVTCSNSSYSSHSLTMVSWKQLRMRRWCSSRLWDLASMQWIEHRSIWMEWEVITRYSQWAE